MTDPGDSEEVRRIEQQIEDLKGRWPSHSVPPRMWDELEQLEEQLDEARQHAGRESHGGEVSPG